MTARTIIGIDLGTTHTVVAYAAGDHVPRLFPMPQLVAHGQVASRALLPSCLYVPLDAERPDDRWMSTTKDSATGWLVGEHARARGGEVPQRLVSSAKSWLCHGQVDRRAAILPWRLAGDPGAAEGSEREDGDAPRISPVAASSLLLEHVRRAWDEAHPEAPMASQEVVLTVPASFDAVARELTVEAAVAVGLEVRLLEEPQAAFYDLMRLGGDEVLEETLGADDQALVLVCDVGGGTTDLSLIRVRRGEGAVEVDRVAVGKHLLLGGDNMDLALAHLCEGRLVAGGERLGPRRFGQLVAACRRAKEQLLGSDPPAEAPIALVGRGSKLVGGALRTQLTRAEVEQVVLDGFVPEVALEGTRPQGARSGIVAFGLPYERDVAITRHLAAFVDRHREDGLPSALLLNGGVVRSAALAARLEATVAQWTGGATRRLELTDPDTSVALGAVAYGLALRGRARRIGGGAARSYFLGLSGAERRAVCVLPRGSEEGQVGRADSHPFELTVGKRVRFELYASDAAAELGVVSALTEDHDRLAPLVTTLADHAGSGRCRVALEAELSAIGTLELGCVTLDPPEGSKARRFALAFDLRVEEQGDRPAHEEVSATARYGKRLEQARAAIGHVYGKKTSREVPQKEVKGLLRTLEKVFGKRSSWDATLNRTLFDVVWEHHRGRRVSVDHERVFWMLAGYCLRPGAGHARDEERAKGLMSLFDQRLAHGETRSWQQFWIAWRRVAAGLDERAQTRLRGVLDPFLAPSEKGLKKPKPYRNDASWEMLDLGASLERVAAARRGELGGWVLERTWTERDGRLWAALGRIGARIPTHGSAHHVVAAPTIERWMDHLLREKWEQVPSATRAAVAMCRLTGDRERDVSDKTRAAVAARLDELGVPQAEWLPIMELVELDDRDRADFYGEDLPVGLSLGS